MVRWAGLTVRLLPPERNRYRVHTSQRRGTGPIALVLLPDVGNRGSAATACHTRKGEPIFERAQYVVVRDVFRVAAHLDVLTVEHGGDAVALAAVVLIEGKDQQAIVVLGPLRVAVDVVL